jgi:hypothetical protein
MKFSVEETRWHGARYYAVKPLSHRSWQDIETWCMRTFGEPGSLWTAQAERYYLNNSRIYFREQGDLALFVLRNS